VVYGGDGQDDIFGGEEYRAEEGEDVLYGGDGNDFLVGNFDRRQRDKLYCGKGWDEYQADKNDYVSRSCKKEIKLIA
jgi:Ca2+-binding RTX toxin-like protein